jgi:hypothetical protein
MNREEMLKKLVFGINPLEVSIEKWQDIVDGKGEFLGRTNCALCERFYHAGFFISNCNTCPVRLRTGESFCAGTPLEDYEAYTDFLFPSEQELKRLAQLELDFLKSLRPLKEA